MYCATYLSRNPRRPEQPMILIHIEWRTADGIRTELARAQVMDEAERGDDEGGCAGELGAAVGGWVVSVRQKKKKRWDQSMHAQSLCETTVRVCGRDLEGTFVQ